MDAIVERTSGKPVFNNEGKYQVISGENVERGKWYADTRPAEQFGGQIEWESLYRLKPENAVTRPDDDLIHNAYKDQGEVIRLWEEHEDPLGTYAKMVHTKLVSLLQSNIPAEEIDDEMRAFIPDVRTAKESRLAKIPSKT